MQTRGTKRLPHCSQLSRHYHIVERLRQDGVVLTSILGLYPERRKFLLESAHRHSSIAVNQQPWLDARRKLALISRARQLRGASRRHIVRAIFVHESPSHTSD